jgi:endonuclease-8
MPEGDTIFRAARALHLALAGKTVTGFETQLPQLARIDYDTPIAGRTIEAVESSGKWMHMRFSGDLTLLTHMLMSGSWHIYRPGEKWKAPARLRARPSLEVGVALLAQSVVAGIGNVFKCEVCFAASVNPFRKVESLTEEEIHTLLSHARAFLSSNLTHAGPRRTTGRSDPEENLWVYKRARTSLADGAAHRSCRANRVSTHAQHSGVLNASASR